MAIHPDAQKLLDKLNSKGRLTGYETGRLLMFNAIDVYSGAMEILDSHRIGEAVGKLKGEQARNYDKYMYAFYALRNVANAVLQRSSYGMANCVLCAKFCESVRFANRNYPECDWEKYGLDTMLPQVSTEAIDFYQIAASAIQFCEMNRLRFEIAGRALKTPGLENMLCMGSLYGHIDEYNCLAAETRAELEQKQLTETARFLMLDLTAPLLINTFQVPARYIEKALHAIKLDKFENTFKNIQNILEEGYRKWEPKE